MELKEFLGRVTAQTDELVIPVITKINDKDVFWNRGTYDNLDDAIADIKRWNADPTVKAVYFSVGNMANHTYTKPNGKRGVSRTKEHATQFKALCFDVDVGADKPYKTQKEAFKATMAAIKALGLPTPVIVSSGYGVHVYYPTLELMDADEWEKYSMALRIGLEENGVEIDTSKIHDKSMVLRPIETHNKKDPSNPKPVEVKFDGGDFHKQDLFNLLTPYVGRAVKAQSAGKVNASGKPKSAVAAAILDDNNINLEAVASRCNQINALIESGGVTDAAGNPVEEPMWRASLGFAKYCEDPEAAIIAMAGQHPDFDLDLNLAKLDGWRGTGPTTCGQFELRCATGCMSCPYRGNQKSPASLSRVETAEVVVEDPNTGEQVVEARPLPEGYSLSGNRIVREDREEVEDDNGNVHIEVKTTQIAAYNMYIEGIYKCEETGVAAFRLFVKYPLMGWKGEDHPISVLGSVGKEFSDFLLNRLIVDGAKTPAQKENLRKFLMDYLTMVQSMAPIGYDYYTFGWQESGAFLCGESIIGCSEGSSQRRLKGGAKSYQKVVRPVGSRDKWVEAMALLDDPGADMMRACVLLGTAGVLARALGNGSMLVSVYSPESSTGKTLTLAMINSLVGSHNGLYLQLRDTTNSFFNARGVLNNLPATVDEITQLKDEVVLDMIYDISSGRDKKSLTRNREQRDPAVWDGPTFTTSNKSLVAKYEMMMAASDPMRARVMELDFHNRDFVDSVYDAERGESRGNYMYRLITENYGWAFPELVEAVIAMGGEKAVADKGAAKFTSRFNFQFESLERKWRSAIMGAWIMGTIGHKLGLFPFDIDETIQGLLDHTVKSRGAAATRKVSVFDVLGQFLQEHNDKLVHCYEVYGTKKEEVQHPAPDKGVARLKRVYDEKNPILPGSWLAINSAVFRKWLKGNGNAIDNIERELTKAGLLLSNKERVTMFKGYPKVNPGQANCHVINMNHQWFIDGMTGTSSKPQSKVLLSVLQGEANG